MRFNELEKVWQEVFRLSWQSFCEGNLPIAAVITDENENIISTGRNHYVMSKRFPNCKVDHAETECLQSLDIAKYPNLKSYIIYTSMEPCPMCIGTIIMSNIKTVRIAARDAWAGASDICEKNAYAQRKMTSVVFENEFLANMQIAMQGYAELKYNGPDSEVYKSFVTAYPLGASVAFDMFGRHTLEQLAEEGRAIDYVFDLVAAMIEFN